MSEPIYVIADLSSVSDKVDALRDALKELVLAVREEPGCIRYDLHESIENSGRFTFYETWSDAEALELHNNTPTMKAFSEKAGSWIASISVNTFRKII